MGMRIGVEMRQVVLGMGGGITLLLRGVLEAAFRLYPANEFILCCTRDNRHVIDESTPNVRGVTLPSDDFFERLDRVCEASEIDLLFRSYPMDVPLRMPMERQVFLAPDLQHETFPEFFTPEVVRSRRSSFNLALARGGAIGTLSDFTRQTILASPWLFCSDVFLMPPALQRSHTAATVAGLSGRLNRVIPRGEYFVYPANLWAHKNHRRLLRAFRDFLERTGRDTQLVLTGDPEGWSTIADEAADLSVSHLGFVPDELVRALLERATALVFFSLYEGFGMPLLEAFDVGTPVICSDVGSLPEVGGGAVLTCDPTDVDAMSRLMERVLVDPDLRARLVSRGRQRVGLYSWERSARSLVEACERVKRRRETGGIVGPRVTVQHAPLVSIVTLRRAIDSVLEQDYSRIEYLVVDGGSTDGSLDILKSYGDRIRWISERDRGQAHALNKGFTRAGGEVLAYLHSDDVLLPRAVGKAVRYLERHPECDLVYGRADHIDENDRVTGEYPTDDYSFPRLMADCCICQPAAFWRARIAAKVGMFDETLDCVMDYDYWLRVDPAGGRIQHFPELLAASRRYPQTKAQSRRFAVYGEIFRTCARHGGFVHLNHFLGLWHHLVLEGGDPRLRWVGRVPWAWYGIAWLHHKVAQPNGARSLRAALIAQIARFPGGRTARNGAVRVKRAVRRFRR
jgi:glycosyltransferase involved in cell wall biosynthesis/GT2 family glycosyltransferase